MTMGSINSINDCNGRDQCHHCEVLKRSRDERPANATRRAVAMSLGATRRFCQQTWQRSCEDVVSITTTILIPQQQSSSKERQLPQQKRDKCKQQSGGPLNRKPQADWAFSCLRSPVTRTSRTTTKHKIKNSCKTIKKQPCDNCATRHVRNTCWTSDAHNWLTPSRMTTKQAQAATTTTKTKITIFILIKKLKAGCVVVISFARLTINGQVNLKEQKERDLFFIFGQWSLILQTPS